ncbi:MAG: hypothetical protein J6O18_10040 [Bacilli bacterium]|nr:hypothetical protein [Bacilli bacterium]
MKHAHRAYVVIPLCFLLFSCGALSNIVSQVMPASSLGESLSSEESLEPILPEFEVHLREEANLRLSKVGSQEGLDALEFEQQVSFTAYAAEEVERSYKNGWNIDAVPYSFTLASLSETETTHHLALSISKQIEGASYWPMGRILIIVDDGSPEFHYYGSPMHGGKPTPISIFDIEGGAAVSKFSSDGNDGYCIPYLHKNLDSAEPMLIEDITFAPNQELKITALFYVEGWDDDCNGDMPLGVLKMSAEAY